VKVQFPCVIVKWSYLNPYSTSNYVSGSATYYNEDGEPVESTGFQLLQSEVQAIEGKEV